MRARHQIGPRTLLPAAAAAGSALVLRHRLLRWGATDDEVAARLPGDDQVPQPDLAATRAITVRVDADQVWPWLAQLGQGRGGFYTYSWLENLAGAQIHNADRIAPQWQALAVGDHVNLAPGMPLDVVHLEPGHALVLGGGLAMGPRTPPCTFSWAFVLLEHDEGCRLVVRERYGYTRGWARLVVEPTEVVSGLMTQRMLRGIRDRAERDGLTRPAAPAPSTELAPPTAAP